MDVHNVNKSVLPVVYDFDFYRQIISIPNFILNVIQCDNKIVGYILSNIKLDNKQQQIAHIMSIGVLESHRRKGYGKQLVMSIEGEAIKKGYKLKYVSLYVMKTNKKAQLFYSKLYFNRSKKLKNYYGKGKDGFLMKLSIES